MLTGLYRVMSKDKSIEVRTVNTKKGETQVASVTLVPYWSPDTAPRVYYKTTFWGDQATEMAEQLTHNQSVYIEGQLGFESYTTKDGVEKTTPIIERVQTIRLVTVQPRSKSEGSSSIANKASGKDNYDDIPF